MSNVEQKDAMDALVTCARGVSRILMDLGESDSMDEGERDALTVLGWSLYNSVMDVEQAQNE